ncbi:MAG: hypothetical protein M3R44_04700 [Candidatus Eremiobacteraeota bacterium]|nr:hypothetical protein [Candidatus Eremiobacteraeota bacterium]
MRQLLRSALVVALLGTCVALAARPAPLVAQAPTFGTLGDQAVTSLLESFYAGNGYWRDCPESRCWVHNSDWGSDSLTNTLYLRWKTAQDPRVAPVLTELAGTARHYLPPCQGRKCLLWSDVPMWDSVAASREYEVLHEPAALDKAKAAFGAVDDSNVYNVGACPAIRYQRPYGRGDHLKTLESDSNGVKAALLLYGETRDAHYLSVAMQRYDAIRHYFLDPKLPLYSVYVFDDGRHCRQVPHRYFASVNGNMIWNGVRLYELTGYPMYRQQAVATARAVAHDLSDPDGVFMDLQAENDLEEPLVEAMFALATQEHRAFARQWLMVNAATAYSARKPDGTYGRFFDGPPPQATVTAWQTNGGLATEIAAAALEPSSGADRARWNDAIFVPRDISRLPATIRFDGTGFALIGTLGEKCCQPGHARIMIDGRETMNEIGSWQNKSSSGRRFPNSVLFAWRWPTRGAHEVTFLPGVYDAKEGGAYLHASGYLIR